MRRIAPVAFLVALLAAVAVVPTSAVAATKPSKTYLVLYKQGTSKAKARAAANARRRAVSSSTTGPSASGSSRARAPRFAARAKKSGAVSGVAANRRIGHAPRDKFRVERSRPKGAKGGGKPKKSVSGDPFSAQQWDMQQIGATPTGSYKYEQGSKAVRVGVMDTGIDGTHPDIVKNFDRKLSRNFTQDDPAIDGPCADDIDGSCAPDPNDVDEDGHGTHVASTIGSPLNGLGMAGVAPKTDLVNLRAGQDSGYFFLLPTVNALTYAGDHGIDVVNMSFYIDPWLFNCASNPADSPEQQQEQRTIVQATNRALDYAHRHGVTLIAAEGNENTDLGHPTSDDTSPDYPDGHRGPPRATVDNGCLSMPSEGHHVLNVTSTGPSKRKAYYSNYGVEQTSVAAPGGDRRDFFGTANYDNLATNEVLAAYPKNVAQALGDIDANGNPTNRFVVRDRNALLPVPAGHLDGLTARRGRGGADHREVRPQGPQVRRSGPEPEPDGEAARADGGQDAVPRAEPVHLPGPRPGRELHRDLRGHPVVQRVLRPRHRERAARHEVTSAEGVTG